MVSEKNIDKSGSIPEFSVVIPIYNEEETIPELYRRLTAVMENLGTYEIILVDDGSKDGSWKMIEELHEKDKRVKGISFSRNFGHHIAILAGIEQCKGHLTVLMDGDLQDQPEEIPKLIEKAREGYDLVQGTSQKRHSNPLRNLFSKMFREIFIKISTVDPKTRIGLFKCLKRPVIDAVMKLPERTIFFGGMLSYVGYSTAYVSVRRGKRYAGKTKYNFLKRFSLAMNAITSFSERPLIYIFRLGILVFFFSIMMFLFAVIKKIFYNIPIIGWTSLFAAIFFSTGLITLSLSIVGLYISRIFIETKQRPRYIIREVLD